MSSPAFGPASRPRAPVGARVPLLAGDWMTTWSVVVLTPNSVVAVSAFRSLFVYADAVTPRAGPVSGGVVRVVGDESAGGAERTAPSRPPID